MKNIFVFLNVWLFTTIVIGQLNLNSPPYGLGIGSGGGGGPPQQPPPLISAGVQVPSVQVPQTLGLPTLLNNVPPLLQQPPYSASPNINTVSTQSSSSASVSSTLDGNGIVGDTQSCEQSITTASGTYPTSNFGSFCSGELIFEDTFDEFDFKKWQHENTLSGGGNWEFQWYTNNRTNSFCDNGFLYIRPTLTADDLGETFLTTGNLNINGGTDAESCTNSLYWGCERTGTYQNILNPIKSARIRTMNSFAFKYGKVEIMAKMPIGDWLRPAITFLPKHNVYGNWPSSGEIDLVESRGNRELFNGSINIGVEQITSTLHFGPYQSMDQWQTSHFIFNSSPGNGWNIDFHRYQMEWTPERITFSIDDVKTGIIEMDKGFWYNGDFDRMIPGSNNPWQFGSLSAPFDQEFYLVMNLAVGGLKHFPDDLSSSILTDHRQKPWSNKSPHAATEFWNGRNFWLPSWNLDENKSRDASLIVDYVRIWAL